jgi:transcriptional antiterminator NusG
VERREGKLLKIIRNMLPGYVLIHTDMNHDLYSLIKQVPRVYRVLSSESNLRTRKDIYYTPIDRVEMETIKKLVGEGDTVESSKVLCEGRHFSVRSGPLTGMEGMIKKIDKRKQRAKVLLPFLGKEVMIDLGIEIQQQP